MGTADEAVLIFFRDTSALPIGAYILLPSLVNVSVSDFLPETGAACSPSSPV